MPTRIHSSPSLFVDPLAWSWKLMGDEGKLLSGFELKKRPEVFIGAAENPFADPFEIRVPRLAKKVEAGAQFIQTECIYNIDKFKKWMRGVVDRGLHEKVFIKGGITPMKTVGMAKYHEGPCSRHGRSR